MARRLLALHVLLSRVGAQFLGGSPIWSANTSSDFVYLRSPDFALRGGAVSSATLTFAALGSPRPPAGTIQAKLLGAAAVRVNGVLVTIGPGHNVPTASQVFRVADVTPFIRADGPNTVAIASFFQHAYAAAGVQPAVQAWLTVTDGSGAYNVSAAATGAGWTAWAADAYHVGTGNAGVSWYPMPNEDLFRPSYPVGWSSPGFAGGWAAAVPAPAWTFTPYVESGPGPVALARTACAVTNPSPGRQILDYGQEFMGGVNLSFTGDYPAGTRVTVVLAEEIMPGGAGVLSPARTGNRWNSTWTLSADKGVDTGLVHHEMVQFRYAQVDGSPTLFTPSTAGAWVIQHPAGGTGRNPWEAACSTSVPATELWGSGPPPATPLGAWTSSNSALDTVWAFAAYTIVGTSLDVNVDGQTRERDVDVVDALNTALGQYAVFSPSDYSIAERTARELCTNDTGQWTQWYDFKSSSVLTVVAHALYTGDLGILTDTWSTDDNAIVAANPAYNALQFSAGLRYFNTSSTGLLHFPATGNACGGAWSCDPLIDWPVGTRDGYDVGRDNSDDTGRSSLGGMAYAALGQAAGWLGYPDAAQRYMGMAAHVTSQLRALNLRHNGSEAFFVDGAVNAPASHAAVHSTLYAISAGAADGDALLGASLTAYLRRHGVAPSSCMMGRWWVQGLYRIGVWAPEAADLALDVLTSPSYPGWLDMMAQGATTTMEAWRPADKSNLDWAHPWCASPSFTIPGGVLGVTPLSPAFARWQLAPQPSGIVSITSVVPSPAGPLHIAWTAVNGPGGSYHGTVAFTVLSGQSARVCLPVPGLAPARPSAADQLLVDGVAVTAVAWGRLACAPTDLAPGGHTVSRMG